jgi:hypothetical protein
VIMAKDDLEQEQQSTEFQVIAKYTCCLFIWGSATISHEK